MRILVIGSGGREHALVWKIRQSSLVSHIYCAPGNGGIGALAECVAIKADDVDGLLAFAREKKVDLTVVGPEVPLVAGLVDAFSGEGLKVFGPSRKAAQLEGSKAFAKDFMARHLIPTAAYGTFRSLEEAMAFLDTCRYPLVVKADGLAAGKGVIICNDRTEAVEALTLIMTRRVFKDAGNRVVIEEFLDGEEASILAVADGKDFIVLESSQDHKRIFDHDEGPNTGGMGAYSPAPVVTAGLMKTIAASVIRPVIDGMRAEGAPFKGILYAGIMVTKEGPKVLEFNTRFGDPETQAVLPRLASDLVSLMLASVEGRLASETLEWDPRACVCVVMAAGGYPGDYSSGKVITGLDAVPADVIVFHAGTRMGNGRVLTAGGRVLGVVALGDGIRHAIERAYAGVSAISFDGSQYRRDIGHKAVKRGEISPGSH